MCLKVLKKIPKKYLTEGEHYGYKNMKFLNSELSFFGEYFNSEQEGYKLNVWYKAIQENVFTTISNEKYVTGFHIYLNKKSAEEENIGDTVIVKVQFKNPTSYGKQRCWNVIVTEYFKIVERFN